ncbi:hypothetical protein BH11PLA2_BH11PLA2_13570 [soil metagenome]
MADTRALLDRIAAFRQRLEETPQLQMAVTMPVLTVNPEPVNEGPPKLTARAQRLLLTARDLVQRQRQLGSDTGLEQTNDTLARFHRGTVGLTESAMRLAQQFPMAVESQLHACDGFEFLLQVIEQRIRSLNDALAIRQREEHRRERLIAIYSSLRAGRTMVLNPLVELANEIMDESRGGDRLRFGCPLEAAGADQNVMRFVATHALNTAQVIARLLPHDYEWAAKPILPVIAALVMDIGLLNVPSSTLFSKQVFTVSDRRVIEAHSRESAAIVRTLLPDSGPLADIVQAHHERPDGTGYPNGLRGDAIPTLARFLHVADIYAALVTARPHRPAMDSRAALTEVLVMAEQGRIDRDFAEYLLNLSFHPVGTVVELVDGRLGVVAANHGRRVDLRATSRPVVAVLSDADGSVKPRPEFVDLAATDRGGILRSIPKAEYTAKLSEWYPDLCV